ncbi:hypothetical protein KJ969_02445 [Patescibacteria group bacterium]|nr:hypothetical protein [Patescibacteria group bacterium]MBU1921645.1 hypothetical protein [Patescibacteria group bacterium]
MTFDEANKIFKVWSQFFWPFHPVLFSIFLGKIPESFLPYPQDVLEEALNIVGKHYFDVGDYKTSEAMKGSIGSLCAYVKDEDALQSAAELFKWRCNDQKAKEAFSISIANFKKDWKGWLEKQEK